MNRIFANGVHLACEMAGEGEPLLLIPGTGGSRRTWRKQVPVLSQRFRVLAVDLRGGGESDKPEGSYTVRRLADDLAALLQALGVERAHVMGTSLGGAIAQELAINYPARVANLVLNSTWDRTESYPYLKRQFVVRQRLAREVAWPLYVAESLPWVFGSTFQAEHPDEVAEFERQQVANPPAVHGLAGHYDADLAHDTAARLHQVKAPTLIVSGGEDLITRRVCAEALRAALPGASLASLPRAGHLTQLEAPEQFGELALAFLNAVRGASAPPGH